MPTVRDPSIKLTAAEADKIRAALRRAATGGSSFKARTILQVAEDDRRGLRKGKLFDRFVQRMYVRYHEAKGGKVGANGDFVKWLLDWIVANGPALIEIIKSIIALFAFASEEKAAK